MIASVSELEIPSLGRICFTGLFFGVVSKMKKSKLGKESGQTLENIARAEGSLQMALLLKENVLRSCILP